MKSLPITHWNSLPMSLPTNSCPETSSFTTPPLCVGPRPVSFTRMALSLLPTSSLRSHPCIIFTRFVFRQALRARTLRRKSKKGTFTTNRITNSATFPRIATTNTYVSREIFHVFLIHFWTPMSGHRAWLPRWRSLPGWGVKIWIPIFVTRFTSIYPVHSFRALVEIVAQLIFSSGGQQSPACLSSKLRAKLALITPN